MSNLRPLLLPGTQNHRRPQHKLAASPALHQSVPARLRLAAHAGQHPCPSASARQRHHPLSTTGPGSGRPSSGPPLCPPAKERTTPPLSSLGAAATLFCRGQSAARLPLHRRSGPLSPEHPRTPATRTKSPDPGSGTNPARIAVDHRPGRQPPDQPSAGTDRPAPLFQPSGCPQPGPLQGKPRNAAGLPPESPAHPPFSHRQSAPQPAVRPSSPSPGPLPSTQPPKKHPTASGRPPCAATRQSPPHRGGTHRRPQPVGSRSPPWSRTITPKINLSLPCKKIRKHHEAPHSLAPQPPLYHSLQRQGHFYRQRKYRPGQRRNALPLPHGFEWRRSYRQHPT